ncbi:PAS/PAC sensor hybrid histidine kinase [Variovorax sp. YR634]|uniref:hybrid sensor histidine kinase/response regulator n=1 Tax=unclassified Variovorax TaxID=663243 RepID=UPI000897E182|nr:MULTISPECIES: PAS domain-containing sensor histidine kinase [unclassified Variovorax]SDW97333.1 PAS/PAC sensor hybrid histidine kinase [Variovorax sp. YR634]SOD28635.1 PAS/PAC sensor hybrid histidine kinase [Variovorax sp. YR752]
MTAPPADLADEAPDPLSGDHRFQLLVDAIKDHAIYLLDAQGRVSSWNTGAQRLKGYSADEIIGQHFSRFYTPEDIATGLPERALLAARTTGRFEAQGWRVRKDGTCFWTSVHIEPVLGSGGALIGYAKVTRDLSQLLHSEQALLASEERFRLLVQGVRDYAIYMLDPFGRVNNWNAGAQLIKGYTAREILGQHFSRFYTAEDRARGEPARALQVALSEKKYESEAWRVRKDGSRFWASVVIDPLYDEAGTHIGFAKITRDITERKRSQDEMDRAREALAQAQKLEAIGRLTGGVAHDFNNLLTVIRSSVELLRRTGGDEARRTRYVEAIADAADRAALLTRQLLAFARQQPLRPEVFHVGTRVAAMKQMIETLVGAQVRLEFEFAACQGMIEADAGQFDTAIFNMAINAKDAMPNGGQLKISARDVEEIPPALRQAAAHGDFLAVSIEDTGTGIEPSTLSRIFDPFFTTKPVTKGTGLGLSQVYGFVKQSGGEIAVVSRVGEGTCFTLYLPRTSKPPAVAVPDDSRDVLPARRDLSILLVEDNDEVGEFGLGLLHEMGHPGTRAASAAEALKILEQQHANFDLVFSDVVMPGINGLELAKEIRRRWPDLPVVLTSGYSHAVADDVGREFELLHKPYSVRELQALFDRAAKTPPRFRRK